MKKLIVFTAAVVMACTVQASQYAWGAFSGEYYEANGDDFAGGTAFLYVLTAADKAPTFADGAWNLNGATLVTSSNFDDGNGGWGNPDGAASDVVVAGSTPGADQQYYAIIITSDVTGDLASFTGDGKYAYIITGQGEQDIYSATDPVEYQTNFYNFDTVTQAGWESLSGGGGAPEPTSGLLLLIGGSLLALRRKQK